MPPARRTPRWRRPRTIALFLAGDAVLGVVLVHVIAGHQDSPGRAVQGTVALAAKGDWAGVWGRLCSADRRQYTAAQVGQAGRLAALTLRGVDHAEITAVTATSLPLDLPVVGVVGLPVRQVTGQLIASLGPPSTFRVITVRELGGWRICLSVGGYASSALQVDVPIGAAPTGVISPDGG